jgi:hypothetical protein
MRWRWVAGILWAAVGAWGFSRTVTNEFSSAGDYGLVAVLLVIAILIATGRGPGGFAAFLGALFSGFITFVIVMANIGSCSFICPPAWAIAPAAALTLASAMASREILRTRSASTDGPPA